jgi:hypothetical protein
VGSPEFKPEYNQKKKKKNTNKPQTHQKIKTKSPQDLIGSDHYNSKNSKEVKKPGYILYMY